MIGMINTMANNCQHHQRRQLHECQNINDAKSLNSHHANVGADNAQGSRRLSRSKQLEAPSERDVYSANVKYQMVLNMIKNLLDSRHADVYEGNHQQGNALTERERERTQGLPHRLS